MMNEQEPITLHAQRLAERMKDPEFKAAYDAAYAARNQPAGSCDECWGLSFHRDSCSQKGRR